MQNGAAYSNTLYTYDNQNHLLSTASTGGAFTRYYYDSNGNLINKITGIMKDITDPSNLTAEDLTHFGLVIKRESDYGTGSGNITSYTYDPYNRLTGYKAENTSAAYQYNAQGYRVEKTVNGETTKYLYEADKVVLETDANNKQTAFQVYGTNLLYRSVASDADTDAQSYYYLYNAHGDVTELIDADGNIAAAYDYDAFGNLLGQTGEADNPARYAGYQYDDESGLYYLNARYYDSVTARFLSEDSYTGERNDPLSLNLYTYCVNNPIRYIDPTGHGVVDYMNEHGMDSSYETRKKIASAMGIKDYHGTAEQNTLMLNNLKTAEANKEKAAKDKAAKDKAAKDKVDKNKDTDKVDSHIDTDGPIVYALAADDSKRLTEEQQESNAEYIYGYLSDEGWEDEAICGLLGNIEVESHFNPGAWQKTDNTSYGYGTVQWDDATKFLSWAGLDTKSADEMAKKDPKKLMDLELEFLVWSSRKTTPANKREWFATTGYYSPYKMTYEEYIKSTKDVGDLALVFHGSYERSADDGSGEVDRSKNAEKWYKYFGK